jgi:hypothetical protein
MAEPTLTANSPRELLRPRPAPRASWKGAGSSYTVLGSISVRQLPPLVLSAAVTGGQFTLQLTGTEGQSYTVELSTNLAAGNWTPVYTNTQSGGVFTFATNTSANISTFFRVTQ